ncbi:MAG: PilN domain-containing protein [Solirubrobacteraceae bacterium]
MRAVNLIPAEQRESGVSLVGRSGGGALAVVVLLAGLAVLAFMYGSAKHSESKSKAELTTVNAELSNARAQAGRLAPYTSFIAMANQRIQEVSALVASRFDWSHAFHELGRVLPRDTSLTSLQGSVGAATGPAGSSSSKASASASATPTSATPPGSTPTFAISGCAPSQSEVAQTLQRLRLMDGVVDVELQSSVKSSPSSSGSSSSGSCSGATFAAQITFAGLPSAPPTNTPGASGGSGATAAGASPTRAEQVSSRGSSR